jgi:hypothetical protein
MTYTVYWIDWTAFDSVRVARSRTTQGGAR